MAARSIASLTVSFGLVSIPVRLFSATEASKAISFNLLHKTCGSRLKQQYFCIKEEVAVPREDMVKGYEFAKDQYVMFTPEELKAMEEAGTHMAEIAEFVPLASVDPVYFDKAYYLGPEKGGEKAYRLLAEVMRETKRVAVARYAARGKQYIVMLRAADSAQGGTGIVMQTLLYSDEVRPFSEVPIGDATVREGELNLAKQLVDQIASETFNPNEYEDDVRKRIQADIDRKVQGQDIAAPAPTAEPARVIDLMEALKASLSAKAKASAAEATPTADETPDAGGIATRRPARRAAGAAPAAAKAEPRKRAAKR